MWFRRSPAAGAATLIVFLTTLVLPITGASHHAFGADIDAGWGEAPIVIGHPVTQVEMVHPGVPGDHCALCHWTRALGHTVAGVLAWHQPDLVTVSPVVLAACATTTGITDSRAPRGPPSIA